MTDYKKTIVSYISHEIEVYEEEGEYFDSIIVPLCKTQDGKAEFQLVYEFDKVGKLVALNSREVA